MNIMLIAGISLSLLSLCALFGGYVYISSDLPRVETLSDYRPPIVTKVYADDGKTQIAEFSRERRLLVPVSRMPKQLVQAFISAEDSNFYRHSGIDFVSILRATIKNLMAGEIVQGGSTITQQVTKSLLLTPEKKFKRKFKEAILSWRIEKTLSKEEILYLYLNQIFLGHGAYGVQAAAENYFDKNVEQLTLAECALLAGLPQAPSRYSPYLNYTKARERQKYVLGRMVNEGYIDKDAADAALAEKLTIHQRVNTHAAGASYFAEQVRRYLVDKYGEEKVYAEGLQVYTTIDLRMQQAAQRAVRENLIAHDRRRGYRGPEKVLSETEESSWLAEQEKQLAEKPLKEGDQIKGVVAEVTSRAIRLKIGKREGEIFLADTGWAAPFRTVRRLATPSGNGIGSATLLPPGSVVLARVRSIKGDRLFLDLDQEPIAEGALLALEPVTGRMKAMVGGYDFNRSHFNRAVQARRLPGSAIKPLIYAAALDKGYSPASIFLDSPLVFVSHNPAGELVEWKPQNYTRKYSGPTSLRTALTHSNNMVTIRVLEAIGVDYAAEYVKRLGIQSPIARDLTFALGSSALTPLELASAYNVFASGGVRISPVYITKVVDRDGRVIESVDPADAVSGAQVMAQNPERVISEETAYLITNMMESVTSEGTAARAAELGRPVAGKTGTTNDLKDAWFVGYVPQLVAAAWIGYDQEKTLGPGETGGHAALPGWITFMQEATSRMEPAPFKIPDTIEFYNIDPATGLLAPDNSTLVNIEAFAPGTAPKKNAAEASKPKPRDFYRMGLDE